MLADRVRISRKNKYIGEVYLAQDDDFVKVDGSWVYRGSELEIEIPHIIQGEKVTSYDYMFYGSGSYLATPVTRVDSNNKSVTDMSYMFYDSSATTLDLSLFDTSKVAYMDYMFFSSSATTLDLSSFDTSNVTNMTSMFRESQATTLDLSNFNTSKVTNMGSMFRESQATTLDLSSFNTSNVTIMSYMFNLSKATTLDLSSFDTSKVTSMSSMFYGSQATTLNLSSFDTSNVTSMSIMFRDSSATTLDVSNFNTSKVTNMSSMFRGTSPTTLDLSSFDTFNVTNMSYMFRDSSATTGYARTQTDADNFNASSNKPSALLFVVKEEDEPPIGIDFGEIYYVSEADYYLSTKYVARDELLNYAPIYCTVAGGDTRAVMVMISSDGSDAYMYVGSMFGDPPPELTMGNPLTSQEMTTLWTSNFDLEFMAYDYSSTYMTIEIRTGSIDGTIIWSGSYS